MPEFDYMSALSVDGQIRSSAQGRLLGSFAVMPAASVLNENAIVLYTGTTGTYVSGQFYMCVDTGSGYEWQTVTISGTEEDTYTADRALVTNSLGQVTASGITAAELGYLSGATSPLQAQINGKVTAVSGMGLSQNSYTTEEKNKLAGIAAGAQVNVIEAVQRNGAPVSVSGKTVNITVPVNTSELTNNSGFITSTVNNLQNYYLKTETYTKTEVNNLIDGITSFNIQVVESLPGSGVAGTFYLVPNSGAGQNIHDEYIWVDNAWELIGTTAFSLDIVQNASGITINGTALQDASASQDGLMTAQNVNDLTDARSRLSVVEDKVEVLEYDGTFKIVVDSATGGNTGLSVSLSSSSGSASGVTGDDGTVTIKVKSGESYNITCNSPEHYVALSPQSEMAVANEVVEVHFTLKRKYKATITVSDSKVNSHTISLTGPSDTQSAPGISSGGSYVFWCESEGQYTATTALPDDATSVKPASFNATYDGEGEYTIQIQYAVVYAVDIAINTADSDDRVTYPATVSIGGQSYDNACYGYTPGSGTDIGSWAQDYDSGTGLISGIVPGNMAGGVFVEESTKTRIPTGGSVPELGTADAMVFVPTWYTWWNNDGSRIRIICCNQQLTSDFKDYAGSLGTNRKGHFYIGCYSCNPSYQSRTGSPGVSITYQNFLTGCQARGTNYDMMTWMQYQYLAMLCVFIWKSTDLQTAFAGGYVNGSSVQSNTALSTTKYGMAGTPGTNSTQKMAFFWIEDLWGNMYQFVGGAHTTSSYKLELNTGLSSISSWDLQTNQGPSSSINGAINKVTGTTDSGFFPLDDGGSYTTYFADYGYVYSGNFARVGGSYNSTNAAGPFYAYFNYSASYSSVGSRLSYRG